VKPSTAIAIFGGIGALLMLGSARAATSRAARLIRETESLSLTPYTDEGGTWHIGYGHKLDSRPPSDMRITERQAERLLREDLSKAANAVDRLVSVNLTPNQRAALISFTYNLGTGALERSTLLDKLNAGNYSGAASEFERWIHVDGRPNRGLRTRREAEKRIFTR
jgi:lysozyme